MNGHTAELITIGRGWLERAPEAKPPGNEMLIGYHGPETGFICQECAGRIMGRGCVFRALEATEPVYTDSGLAARPHPCALCDAKPVANPTGPGWWQVTWGYDPHTFLMRVFERAGKLVSVEWQGDGAELEIWKDCGVWRFVGPLP